MCKFTCLSDVITQWRSLSVTTVVVTWHCRLHQTHHSLVPYTFLHHVGPTAWRGTLYMTIFSLPLTLTDSEGFLNNIYSLFRDCLYFTIVSRLKSGHNSLDHSECHNNNMWIYKAHNVSKQAESEAINTNSYCRALRQQLSILGSDQVL